MSDELLETLQKACRAIYTCADEGTAKEISITFGRAANRIKEQGEEIAALQNRISKFETALVEADDVIQKYFSYAGELESETTESKKRIAELQEKVNKLQYQLSNITNGIDLDWT